MSKNKQLNGWDIYKSNQLKQAHKNLQERRLLKDRFLEAVVKGALGRIENRGVIVTLKEFKAYFSDIKSDYVNSFLPAATFEPGQSTVTHTKFLFRVRRGVYLVHPDALRGYRLSSI